LERLDDDHVPTCHEIARLRQRAIGDDRRGVRTAVAHPRLRGRERLRVNELPVLLEQFADVPKEYHVRFHVLWRPLVHRGYGPVRLRAAAVVLQAQVLRYGSSSCRGPSLSWPVHLVSGAGQGFSTHEY